MATYQHDRKFSDYVHHRLALPLIYEPLGWSAIDAGATEMEKPDMTIGVDYVMWSKKEGVIGIQERFRDAKYARYSDATLRYRRDGNPHADRVESEFYKIRAAYLVYGIVNGSKNIQDRDGLTDFVKWVVLDLNFLRDKVRTGHIVIDRQSELRRCRRDGDKLRCPEIFNRDGSSSFIPFDVPLIHALWGNAPIPDQKGFVR